MTSVCTEDGYEVYMQETAMDVHRNVLVSTNPYKPLQKSYICWDSYESRLADDLIY